MAAIAPDPNWLSDFIRFDIVSGGDEIVEYNVDYLNDNWKYSRTSRLKDPWRIIVMPANDFLIKAIYKMHPMTMQFNKAKVEAEMGVPVEIPELKVSIGRANIAYLSSNEKVAKVNPTTGEVTLVGPGEATVTATFEGNEHYEANEASYLLVVSDYDPDGIRAVSADQQTDEWYSVDGVKRGKQPKTRGIYVKKGKKELTK